MSAPVDGPDVTIPRTHATTPHPGGQTDPPITDGPHTDGPHTHAPKTDAPVTDKPDHSGKFHCKSAGFFPDPKDPRKFHQCVNFSGKLKDYEFNCPEGSKYDAKLHICA